MAVKSKESSALQLEYDLGEINGKTKTRKKTYSDIKETVSVEDLYETSNSLASLQIHPLSKIYLNEKSQIKEI